MRESFFQPVKPNESDLYRRLRDDPNAVDLKQRIETLWYQYQPIAPKGLVKKAQHEFHQVWWEIYLGIGLMNLGFEVKPSPPHRKGPDIQLPFLEQKNIWVEAVAPNVGTTSDKIPESVIDGVADFPKEQCLFRLATALESKAKIFHDYQTNLDSRIIKESDFSIIALSACALNQLGSLLEFPAPAPLSIFAGAGNLVLSSKQEKSFVEHREFLCKDSGSNVSMNFFENEQFNIISAVLYSFIDPLNAPDKPETTFQLFVNPNATNQIPSLFIQRFETWIRVSKNTGESLWTKTPRLG
jgi:hypothetical protein